MPRNNSHPATWLTSALLRGPSHSAAALLIAAVIVTAYATSLNASFQFDDWNVIVDEARVQSLSAWWQSMPGIRALTKFTYALNNEFENSAAGFRALNILIHYGTAALVFVLIEMVATRLRWSAAEASWTALWVALVFAAHPAQSEAITYICGRSGSLAAFLALASLVVWLRAAHSTVPSRSRQLSSAALFALAIAAKETMIVMPCALLLLIEMRTRGPGADSGVDDRLDCNAAERRAVRWHWLVAAGVVAIILVWPPYQRLIATSLDIRSMGENLLTQANALGYLLGQLVRFDHLNADPRLPILTVATPRALLRCLFAASGIIAALVMLRRRPAVAFGLLWFFVWLAPTNSLLARYEVANDRQLYLSVVAAGWLLACGARSVLRRCHGDAVRIATAIIALLSVATLSAASAMRNRVYATEVSFWSDVVDKTPGNARAANNLGYALALVSRPREAAAQFERAIQIDPNYVKARINLRLLRDNALMQGQR